MFSTLFSLALLPCVLGAQFEVAVGGPGVLKFDPPVINASVGDVVQFTFKQKNHTATQSTFEHPCQLAPNGFDSGFVPVADTNTGPFPVAQYIVEDTNPVWVYCRQANHCQQGMVFAINPGDKFAAFQAAAMGSQAPIPSSVLTSTPVQYTPPAQSPPAISAPPVSSAIPPPSFSTTDTQRPEAPTPSVSSPALSSTSPSTPSAIEHRVIVGGPNRLFFSPANISVAVGDVITFEFRQKNHTVTQSTFANPCVSLTDSSTSGQIGFDSGFMPVPDSQSVNFPMFKVTVNDSSPIWAFCRQATHCGQGMVFSANAVESGPNNFAAFQAKAMQVNGTNSASSSVRQRGWSVTALAVVVAGLVSLV